MAVHNHPCAKAYQNFQDAKKALSRANSSLESSIYRITQGQGYNSYSSLSVDFKAVQVESEWLESRTNELLKCLGFPK